MLVPENGASQAMYRAKRPPAATPVQRAKRDPETCRTAVKSKNEIAPSAASATIIPEGPGMVIAKRVFGCESRAPSSAQASTTPTIAPATWNAA